MKDKLVFDVTDVDTILDSDSVGAFIRSDDGTLITHHTVGGDQGLDVYLLNASLVVEATDLDIRALTTADEITVFQGTSPWVIGDGGGAITVDAIDLDIRDLSAASDSVAAHLADGAGTGLTSTTIGADIGLDVNIIGGVSLEVDLDHTEDSVRLGDGTNFLSSTTIGADVGLDVNVINDPSTAAVAIASAANPLAVANTAEDVVVAPLANRKYLFVYNNGNRQIFVGASGVTSASGFPLSPYSYLELRAGAAVDVEWVGPAVGQEIRTLELS